MCLVAAVVDYLVFCFGAFVGCCLDAFDEGNILRVFIVPALWR